MSTPTIPIARLTPILLLLLAAAAPGQACPRTPADLFDLKAIHAMSLKDLGWKAVSRKKLASGVTFVRGDWSGGLFATFDARGKATTIQLHEHAGLYLPAGYPKVPAVGKGLVHAAHVAPSAATPRWGDVCAALQVPILSHGEHAVDWQTLGFSSRQEMIGSTFKNAMRVNPWLPVDLTRGNFAWALARTQILAVQLLKDLLASAGGRLDQVALQGGSKEGFSTWMASAVEPKIVTAAPGAYQQEDLRGTLKRMVTDWSGEGSAAGGLPVPELLDFAYWLDTTPAGACALGVFSVQRFQVHLRPGLFLINGDVALANMHDGHYFPLGCETPFLDGLGRPWTYDRRPDDTREPSSARQKRLMALLADALVRGPATVRAEIPRVLATRALGDDRTRRFRVQATTARTALRARVWWSYSRDRRWNDPGQAGWNAVAMTRNAPGAWETPAIQAPAGMEVGWYVEAENSVKIGTVTVARRDASPVRFLWEHPFVVANAERFKVGAGGRIDFTLAATPLHAGKLYFLLGSASGIHPGLSLGGHLLPLNLDGYLGYLAYAPNTLIKPSLGALDGSGGAAARMALPPLPPALAGLTLHHAYVVMGTSPPSFEATSNAAPLKFIP